MNLCQLISNGGRIQATFHPEDDPWWSQSDLSKIVWQSLYDGGEGRPKYGSAHEVTGGIIVECCNIRGQWVHLGGYAGNQRYQCMHPLQTNTHKAREPLWLIWGSFSIRDRIKLSQEIPAAKWWDSCSHFSAALKLDVKARRKPLHSTGNLDKKETGDTSSMLQKTEIIHHGYSRLAVCWIFKFIPTDPLF